MSSIGRTHHLRCAHPDCNKRRPYWSQHCKAHRVLPVPAPNRDAFESANGLAHWWSKDGAWHIALPDPSRGPHRYWTETMYATREDAIAALAKAGAL